MPKYAEHKLLWDVTTRTYEFCRKEISECILTSISNDYDLQACIVGICSFAFEGKEGNCTVRIEAKQRGGQYWYAYHRRHNKMIKCYLGRSSNLTLILLERAVHRLQKEPQRWNGPHPKMRRGGAFSELLEEFRLAKGLTKKDLAMRSNLTSSYISLLTRGERKFPSQNTITSLAAALGLSNKDRMKLLEAAGYFRLSSIKTE